MTNRYRLGLWIMSLAFGLAASVQAQDDPSEATPERPIYIALKPPFVVNYGGAGRLKYLKAELSVRVENSSVANSVRHHMPFIRNNIVMLFSRQTTEMLETQEGKEMLRQEALEEVRRILMEEDKKEGVVDLFFNSFIIQK